MYADEQPADSPPPANGKVTFSQMLTVYKVFCSIPPMGYDYKTARPYMVAPSK
jgi:hypothetical protein